MTQRHRIPRVFSFLSIVFALVFCSTILRGQTYEELSVPITMNYSNISTLALLEELKAKTAYTFSYAPDELAPIKLSNIRANNKPLGTFLQELTQYGLRFERSGKMISVAFQKPVKQTQRSRIISGKVVNEQNKPLSGATIAVKDGGNAKTNSDAAGNYRLAVDVHAKALLVSYLGYKEQEVAIGSGSTVNVQLFPAMQSLEDVVVVGYGMQKRRDLTGSITSVSSKDIKDVPVSNVVQALQGKVAGMDIQNNGGAPGAGASIRIRGNRSITASNDPLVVLDGIPTLTNINDINFADIASVEVLKDASASAIYGSRGANGVILLATKQGKQGKVTVNYDGYYGISNPFGKVTLFNGEEYAAFQKATGRQLRQWELDALAAGTSTDYLSYLYKTGHQQNHSLSFAGGNEKTTFYISGNYFNEEGTIHKADYTRYNVRINLNQKISEKLSIGTTTLLSRSDRDAGVYPLIDASEINPLSTPFNEDGSIKVNPDDESLHLNPLLQIYGPSSDATKTTTVITNMFGEYKIVKGLKYRLNIGLNNADSRRGYFNSSMKTNGSSTAGWQDGSMFDYTIENILSYQLARKDHKLDLTGLYSIGENTQESEEIAIRGIPYDSQEFYNLGSAEEVTGKASDLSKRGIASYMARAQYGYKDKYLATFTIRADGASIFAPGHKWGYFPSAALAWRVSEEKFFKAQTLFDDLKVRGSYGVVGNPGISPYRTQGTLLRTTYSWDDAPAFGYGPGEIPNPELKWESTASIDLGIDLSMLQGRLSGTIDLYRQNTSDLLLERALPSSTGFNSTLQNIGKTRNTGAEVSINASLLPASSKFQWNVNLNGFTNHEEIVALNSGMKEDVGNLWFVGHPISVIFDYEKIGIWQTSEKDAAAVYGATPGQIKIKDQDGNGVIDDQDRTILGSNRPKWEGGLTSSWSYAGFDLSLTIYTRNGQMIRDINYVVSNQMEAKNNNLSLPYWTEENPTNVNPKPADGTGTQYISTLGYFSGSYTTLQNVNIGYNFPERITKRLGIGSFRIYLSGRNLMRLSKNKIPSVTLLPENNGVTDISLTRANNDVVGVPLNRTFNIGINLGF